MAASRCFGFRFAPAFCAAGLLLATSERAPAAERIVIRLPEGVEPAGLVPYGALGAADVAPGLPLRIPSAAALERLLRDAGAAQAARLADGLADAPPEWRRTFLVELPASRSADAVREIASSIVSARLAESATRDARYEPLVVKGFNWGAGPAVAPGPQRDAPSGAGPRGSWQESAARSGFFPDDSLFVSGAQWGLYNTGLGQFGGVAGVDVRAPEAWASFSGSTATILGIVDTGIDPAHPELNRTMVDGTPRLVAALAAAGPSESPADSVGHGTMVSGVAAALTNNGLRLGGLGVAGMAGGSGGDSTGVRLVAVKATRGHGSNAGGGDLARAIVLAYEHGARAVNVSFGGDEPAPLVREACKWVADRGTTVIFGAGNSADSRPQYPGFYAQLGVAVSVGAIDPSGELAVFSTYGDQVDAVAPGEDIWSTWPTYANGVGSPLRNFAHTSGTSFSAPLVTGMAGLAYGLRPDLTGNDFQQILRRTARDWGQPGRDEFFGYGFVDAAALVEKLLPPWGVVHGTAAATSWEPAGLESLRVADSGIVRGGCTVDGDYLAERFVVRAVACLPVATLSEPQAWVRPGGPGGWSAGRVHEANIPWGEARPGAGDGREVLLTTNVYRIDAPPSCCPTCPPIGWLPRPPGEVAMEWTAWARLDAPPVVRIVRPVPGEVWEAGSPQQVEWVASDPDTVTCVYVFWVPDSSGVEWLLGRSQVNPGSLAVTVPCRPPAGSGSIRVVARDDHDRLRRDADAGSAEVAIAISGADCPATSALLALAPPHPNPARGSVRFDLQVTPSTGIQDAAAPGIRLAILDARGRLVRKLTATAGPTPGDAFAVWDGATDAGHEVSSGVYIVRVGDGARAESRRFVWLRPGAPHSW